MGFKVNLSEIVGFPNGFADTWLTQFPADTYTVGTVYAEAVDCRLYHQFGVVACTIGTAITGDWDVFLQSNTIASGGDPNWAAAAVTWQRNHNSGTLLTGPTIAGNTWTAASEAGDNVIYDMFKTESLPAGQNFVRLGMDVAQASGVAAAMIFAESADYSALGDWGDIVDEPAE